MKFEIKNRYTGVLQFVAEIECNEYASHSVKLGLAVKWGIIAKADLSGADLSKADLRWADLRWADLSGADLSGADLRKADLSKADLRWADLRWADLSGADLSGADLSKADLRWADLSGADLSGADLRWADLSGADLRWADLSGADLSGADLRKADLSGADLRGAQGIPLLIASQLSIIPDGGDVIGWKKCKGGVIVKLCIPQVAKRSNATGRKCRAEYADVLEVIGADVGISSHDGKTEYRVGQRVTCDKWEEDRWKECSGGIHFFITRAEAEAY